MKLYNTLTKQVAGLGLNKDQKVGIYSCGPTVYNHIHIGNLRAFITADVLRRSLQTKGYQVKHVMNITDVDDKTIAHSQEQYPGESPETALLQLTQHYTQIFITDMQLVGNDTERLTIVKATDSISLMQALITRLIDAKFAYIADDGVYFSIKAYRDAGKTYGQLLQLSTASTSAARIDNDEYDKTSAHDFALWKTRKNQEPAWEYTVGEHNLLGRPGWHIECSAMSTASLGQPFDIHTGGIDLIFPHHENEIAQSTAIADQPLAEVFVHNEHLLVDGRKMSKSLDNYFTLRDIQENNFDPLAYRLLVLQAHYRKQMNFTWKSLTAAQNRLSELRQWSDLRFQLHRSTELAQAFPAVIEEFIKAMQEDLDTPLALATLSKLVNLTDTLGIDSTAIGDAVAVIDSYLGLGLTDRHELDAEQQQLLNDRGAAREQKDWEQADQLRRQLEAHGISVRDTPQGQIWGRS